MTKMDYLLINVYIGNREQCQLETLQNLSILLENYDNFYDKNMILAGHFNLFFNKKLNCKRGKTTIEKQSVSHYLTKSLSNNIPRHIKFYFARKTQKIIQKNFL